MEQRQLTDLVKKVAVSLHLTNAALTTSYQLEVQTFTDVGASILDLVAAPIIPPQHVDQTTKDVDVSLHRMVVARIDSLLQMVLTLRDVHAIRINLAAVLMELPLLRDLIVKVVIFSIPFLVEKIVMSRNLYGKGK